jgi:hypothetical protein
MPYVGDIREWPPMISGSNWTELVNYGLINPCTSFPVSPKTNQMVLKTNENIIYRWTGATWGKVTPSGLGDLTGSVVDITDNLSSLTTPAFTLTNASNSDTQDFKCWINISIMAQAGASGYTVHYKPSSLSVWFIMHIGPSGSGAITVSTPYLEEATQYDFKANTVSMLGNETAWSATQQLTTMGNTDALSAPSGLVATPLMAGVLLDWTSLGLLGESYKVYRNTSNATGSAFSIGDVIGTVYTWRCTGSADYVPQYFWVKSITKAGVASVFSSSVTATPLQVLTGDLHTGSVTANILAANSVYAENIVGSTITGDKLVAGTISGSLIAAYSITGSHINGKIISGEMMVAETISGNLIQAGTISGSHLASNTITASNISGSIAILEKIWADTITGKTLQTASSGNRLVLGSDGFTSYGECVWFKDLSGSNRGVITCATGGTFSIMSLNPAENTTTLYLIGKGLESSMDTTAGVNIGAAGSSNNLYIWGYTYITGSTQQSWDNDYFAARYGYHGDVTNNSGTVLVSLRTTGRIVCESEIDAFSDKRLKDLIKRVDSKEALEAVNNLSPVQFKWKPETGKGDKITTGFFAQEVGPYIPEAVYTIKGKHFEDEHYLTYDVIFTYAISAVQELSKQNKGLRLELDSLKKEVEEIKRSLK